MTLWVTGNLDPGAFYNFSQSGIGAAFPPILIKSQPFFYTFGGCAAPDAGQQ